MTKDEHIKLLQLTYANVLADATNQFGREGVLDNVTARKRKEQLEEGATKAAHFNITSAQQVFTQLSAVFGCADWRVNELDDGFSAISKSCVLCGLAKKKNAPSPCRLYCLDPMEGLVKGVEPKREFCVEDTLWTGEECRIVVSSRGSRR